MSIQPKRFPGCHVRNVCVPFSRIPFLFLIKLKMNTDASRHIALISVHGDPAEGEIGKEEAGGQNVYVRQLGLALSELGWTVEMYTRRTDPSQAQVVHHGPRCKTIRLTAGPCYFVPRDELFTHLPAFVKSFCEWQKNCESPYSVVHTNYWLSGWVGMELKKSDPGLKHVHTNHSLGVVKYQTMNYQPKIATTRLSVEKACVDMADCSIATTEEEAEVLRSLSQKGQIEIVSCGADVVKFGSVSHSEARFQLNIPSSALVVLYVGRFAKQKGIDTLIRAVSASEFLDQDLRLILVGGQRVGQIDEREHQRLKVSYEY